MQEAYSGSSGYTIDDVAVDGLYLWGIKKDHTYKENYKRILELLTKAGADMSRLSRHFKEGKN